MKVILSIKILVKLIYQMVIKKPVGAITCRFQPFIRADFRLGNSATKKQPLLRCHQNSIA